MSKLIREFWIDERDHDGLNYVSTEPVDGCVHVINYESYQRLLDANKKLREGLDQIIRISAFSNDNIINTHARKLLSEADKIEGAE